VADLTSATASPTAANARNTAAIAFGSQGQRRHAPHTSAPPAISSSPPAAAQLTLSASSLSSSFILPSLSFTFSFEPAAPAAF